MELYLIRLWWPKLVSTLSYRLASGQRRRTRHVRPQVESLEQRLTLTYSISVVGGAVTIVASPNDQAALEVSFQSGAGGDQYVLADGNGLLWQVGADSEGAIAAGNGTSTLILNAAQVASFDLTLGDQDDIFTIQSATDDPWMINLGPGNDACVLVADMLRADVTVNGGDGIDAVTANRSALGNDFDIDLYPFTITVTGQNDEPIALVTYNTDASIESLTINGSAGADRFTVHGTSTVTTINGGGGADIFTVNGTGAAGLLKLNGEADDDLFTINASTALAGAVDVSGGSNSPLSPPDNDALTVLLSGTDFQGLISQPTTITDDDPVPTSVLITYNERADIESLTINGSAGADRFTVHGTSTPTTINGGGGNDIFAVHGTGAAGLLKLNGEAGDDLFIVTPMDALLVLNALAGAIDVSGGSNSPLSPADNDALTLYTPPADFNGELREQTFTITVNPVNDPPQTVLVRYNTGRDIESLTINGSPGADKFTVQGTSTPTTINGGGGNDIFDVNGTRAAGPLTLNGEAGDDLFTINASTALAGAIDVSGGSNGPLSPADNDALTVFASTDIDSGETASMDEATVTITVTGANDAPIALVTYNKDADIESLTINGSAGADKFTVHGTSTPTTIHGGGGADIFDVNGTGAAGPLKLNGDAGDDLFTINASSAIVGPISVSGGSNSPLSPADNDALVVTYTPPADFNGELREQTFTITVTGANDEPETVVVTYNTDADIESLTINGSAGADKFTVNGTSTPTTINGGGGNDIFDVHGTGAAGPLMLRGEAGDDMFTINASSATAGLIDVSGGSNGPLSPADNDALGITVTLAGDDVDSDDSPAITLHAENSVVVDEPRQATVTVTVTGVNDAPVAVLVTYNKDADIESLTINGSAGADKFTVDGTSTPTTINGGGGNDIFDVHGTGAAGLLTLNGEAGDDRITINASSALAGPIDVSGGSNNPLSPADNDALTVFVGDDVDEASVGGEGVGGWDIVDNSEYDLIITFTGQNAPPVAVVVTYAELTDIESLTINGSAGPDRFTVNGTSTPTKINGGGGQDTFTVNGTGAAGPLMLNGGRGDDTYRLNGAGVTLDLTVLADNQITGLETIDLRGSGANTLTLNAQEVLNLSDTSNTLTVRLNADDTLNRGAGWTQGANVSVAGVTYLVFTQGAATLRVEKTDNLAPTGTWTAVTTPTDTAVNSVVITFSEAVQKVTLANLTLNGKKLSRLKGVSIAGDVSANTFVISGLSRFDANGRNKTYTVAVISGNTIKDLAENALSGLPSVRWVMNRRRSPRGD